MKFQSLFIFILLHTCLTGRFVRASHEVDQNNVPRFNAEAAYQFIQEQVNFGPRVPNTNAHRLCGTYLQQQLTVLGGKVHIQHFQARAFDGQQLQLQNIIASFNPTCRQRVLLAAHWDTRPFADKDVTNQGLPIEGANDGASGVGVLLEIARVLVQNPPSGLGVDIIFFDGEDYGPPHAASNFDNKASYWCLGAQYWSHHLHVPDYTAVYGILLDMVGANEATFYQEHYSMHYAPDKVKKVWHVAQALGYSQYFIPQKSQGYILDDHVFVNELAQIPMINVIDHLPAGQFFKAYHHTHADNLQLIDKKTLQAVGETLLHMIYTTK